MGVLTGEDPKGRCHLEDGTPISAAVARRLGCDAQVVAITERQELPIDVGRSRRLFTKSQRRALQARDGTCRFPGCGVPARRTHLHHLFPWELGGPTDLANASACVQPTMVGSMTVTIRSWAAQRGSCASRPATAARSCRRHRGSIPARAAGRLTCASWRGSAATRSATGHPGPSMVGSPLTTAWPLRC